MLNVDEDLQNPHVPIEHTLQKVRRFQVHEINKERKVYGQYHHLFPVLKRYPDKFQKYMRMQRETFAYILNHIEGKLDKNWCNLHQPIYTEERLVLTIRFLATGHSYSELAFTFRMGDTTVCTIIKEVMEVLWNVLEPIHMPIPTEDHLRNIANDFFVDWKFPHCLGAVDCRHMRIKKPAHSGKKYFNWKGFYSVKLQAIVGPNYKFIFVEAGDYGSTHDSATFKNSALMKSLETHKFEFLKDDELPNSGTILPYFLIGDGAYALQEHLMKPFRGKDLPLSQLIYNERLSSARMVVECAFGHLVQIWRIFLTMMQQEPETVTWIIKCACILRNVIIDREHRNVTVNNHVHRDAEVISLGNALLRDQEPPREFIMGFGQEVREELMSYLILHP